MHLHPFRGMLSNAFYPAAYFLGLCDFCAMLCLLCRVLFVLLLWTPQMLDALTPRIWLQNVRAGHCQDQHRTITSFYREGKLDHLRIGKMYTLWILWWKRIHILFIQEIGWLSMASTMLMITLNIYQKILGFHCIVCTLKKGVWLTFPDRW